jgi:hypothetical protein
MSIRRKIEFVFTKTTDNFNISLIYLLEQINNLKQIIINECNLKNNLLLLEDNIVIYDINNDIIINTVQDLVENKTKKCKIIIKPISY